MYEDRIPEQRERAESLRGTPIYRGERRFIIPGHLLPDPGNERHFGEVIKHLRRGTNYPGAGNSWSHGMRTNVDPRVSVGTHWSTNPNVSRDNFAWMKGNQTGVPASASDRRRMRRGWNFRVMPEYKANNMLHMDDRLSDDYFRNGTEPDAKPFVGRFLWHGTIDNPEEQLDTESPWTPHEDEINLKLGATVPIHAVSYAVAPSGQPHSETRLSRFQFPEPIRMPIGQWNKY